MWDAASHSPRQVSDGVVNPCPILLGDHLVTKHSAALMHPQSCQIARAGCDISSKTIQSCLVKPGAVSQQQALEHLFQTGNFMENCCVMLQERSENSIHPPQAFLSYYLLPFRFNKQAIDSYSGVCIAVLATSTSA